MFNKYSVINLACYIKTDKKIRNYSYAKEVHVLLISLTYT
jgi:hypothetical protein